MQKIRFPRKTTPRWIWFAVEQLLVALCFYMAASFTGWLTLPALALNTVTAVALALYFNTSGGIVRYTGIGDIRRIVKFAFGLMLVWWLAFVCHHGIGFLHQLPLAFPLVNAALVCFIDTGSRLLVKQLYARLSPPTDRSWKSRMYHVEELTAITIGSLLQREEIRFENEHAFDCFAQKVVLVSGAAGSIGSEICRQLFHYPLHRIILLDQSESGLFDFELELRSRNQAVEICVEVASVRDKQRIEMIFSRYQPDFVFHAAAYKHVPVMEVLPSEAILTNVWGTRIMADAAVRTGIRKFIMVSSDKAVNPSTIMGATKSIAEIYIQALSGVSGNTQFITTRFGNVLGSTGSVVPLFIRQILNGGPVTVTHPEVTRYFMTIPEASRLVIEACVMGQGGEVFVFNMGDPIKILAIARQLIRLAGYTPGKEIAIKFIGLRQGEKIHEELFNPSEHLMPTHHPRIMKARTRDLDTASFGIQLEQLIEAAAQHRQEGVRDLIVNMVPDFKQKH
ncbi:MAG TPA: UDP-N-acetylglucosamine 4,6-dehydratase family protein [Puia sp.]|nr:UDP-N-acetylglucosamine 4,6-dehydratase family protein [Puia sp.]